MNEEKVNQHHINKRAAAVFGAKIDFSTGPNPYSIALGDVNEDGYPDIITGNSNCTPNDGCFNSSVSVLLGNGTGSFNPKTDFATGNDPRSVALADVNGDGHLDIVTANTSAANVSVLLGDGTGSFGAKTDFETRSGSNSVALGDVNGDGHLDIVTANSGAQTASVLLGSGAGSFGPKTDFATGNGPVSVALGDVNGDGHLDIVIANSNCTMAGCFNGSVSVLLGDGTGNFGAKNDFSTGDGALSVALGDVNEDGHLDIVTANASSCGRGGCGFSISVLLGTGAGDFGAAIGFARRYQSASLVLGDVDGDGHLDIVTANGNVNSASALLGDGTGSFGDATDFTTGAAPLSVALADVDGNGSPDIVTANRNADTASVLLNQISFFSPASSQSPHASITLNQTTPSLNISASPLPFPTPSISILPSVISQNISSSLKPSLSMSSSVSSISPSVSTSISPRVSLSPAPSCLGSEFQVNTYTNSSQDTSSVAMDSAGNFVVTWQSYWQDGSYYGIYGQCYSATGVAIGSEFQVNTYTFLNQLFPSVAMDSAGNFVVTWNSDGQDGSLSGIYGQRYSAAGIAIGSEFQVNTYTFGPQTSPSVAMDSAGDFVVTWEDYGQDGDGYGVYGQRYSAAGERAGSEFQVNTYTLRDQLESSVAMDSAGNFVVTWISDGQDGSSYGIYGQRYSAAGIAIGSEFQVNTYTFGPQTSPSVAMDGAGNFVVTWQSGGQDRDGYGIYGQRYSALGERVGSEFQVNTYTLNDQELPSVAMDSVGNFVVTWQSGGQDGDGYGIYSQRYSASGERVGSEFQVNTYTLSAQQHPSVAMNSAGSFVVTWTSLGQDGSSNGIFARECRLGEPTPSISTSLTASASISKTPSISVTRNPESSHTSLSKTPKKSKSEKPSKSVKLKHSKKPSKSTKLKHSKKPLLQKRDAYQGSGFSQVTEIADSYSFEWAEAKLVANDKIEQSIEANEHNEPEVESSSATRLSFMVPEVSTSLMLGVMGAKMVANTFSSIMGIAQSLKSAYWDGTAPEKSETSAKQAMDKPLDELLHTCHSWLKQQPTQWLLRDDLEELIGDLQAAKKESVTEKQFKKLQDRLEALKEEYSLPTQAAPASRVQQQRRSSMSFFAPAQQPMPESIPVLLPQAPARERIAA